MGALICFILGHGKPAFVSPDQYDPDQQPKAWCARCGKQTA